MQLSFEPDPKIAGGLVVRLSGNLEIEGAEKLWNAVAARTGPETRYFLFDFSGVPIITSAGIGTLVRVFVRLRGLGGAIAICGCSDKIREVFSVVMLDKILKVCGSEEEAREQLQ
jgi:anti-anti-sigma factor